MGRNISDKLRIGDWIKIPLTVEPETYLKLDESNVGYYNKLKKEIIGSGPRKVNVIEVKKYYEAKIKEHKEEAALANRFAEVYKYKLRDIE